ncbi:hypothetical protein RUND412_001790 [Rhizina undulata]
MPFRCHTKILTDKVFDKSNGFSQPHYASSTGKALMDTLEDFMDDGTITGITAAWMLQNFVDEMEAQSRHGWNLDLVDAISEEFTRASPSDTDDNSASDEDSVHLEKLAIIATNFMVTTPEFHFARGNKHADLFSVTLLGDFGDWQFKYNKMVHVMHFSNVDIQIIGRAGEYLEEFAPRLTIFTQEDPEAQVETPPAAAGNKRKRVEDPNTTTRSKKTKGFSEEEISIEYRWY